MKTSTAINRLRKLARGRNKALRQMEGRGLSRKELRSAILAHDRDLTALDIAITAMKFASRIRSVK